MSSLGLLLLPVATSLMALLIARRAGPASRSFRHAVHLTLELAGTSTLFLAANIALGVGVVLTLRAVTSVFVSIYVLNDLSIVALSFLQGAVFFCWRRQP